MIFASLNGCIDKKGALEELRSLIGRALGFAIGRGYPTKETIPFIIGKAGREEKAIQALVDKQSTAAPAEVAA